MNRSGTAAAKAPAVPSLAPRAFNGARQHDRPRGLKTALAYLPNAQGRWMQAITNTSGNATVSAFSYVHDAAGMITHWTQNQPGDTVSPVKAWSILADRADQIESVTVANHPGDNEAFTYDPAGNRLTAQRGNAVTTASYNSLNQIKAITGNSRRDQSHKI